MSATATQRREQRAAVIPATFYVHDTGSDNWWRAEEPARVTGSNIAKIPVEQTFEAFTEPNTHTPLPWSIVLEDEQGYIHRANTIQQWNRLANARTKGPSMYAVFPSHKGAAVFTTPARPHATLAESMAEQGIRTIFAVDDNYFAKEQLNLLLRRKHINEAERALHAKVMWRAQVNVFSTAWLRDRYHKELRRRFGKKGMPELVVCRNHVDLAQWPERIPRENGEPVRVGFTGSVAHVWDIDLAYGAFAVAKEAGATTTVIGYNPAAPDGDELTRTVKSKQKMEAWAKLIDRHVPWTSPAEYHATALPLDIGVCPMFHNDFTAGKSDSKAVEYTISGAAVVAMNVPVYNENWTHEETALLANTPEELALCVLRLIDNQKLRYELVSNAQEYVRDQRGAPQMRAEWMEAIRG